MAKTSIKVTTAKPTQKISGVVLAQPKAKIVPLSNFIGAVPPKKTLQDETVRKMFNFPTNEPTALSTPQFTTTSDPITRLVSGEFINPKIKESLKKDFGAIKKSISEKSLFPLSERFSKVSQEISEQNKEIAKNPSNYVDILSTARAVNAFEKIASSKNTGTILKQLNKIGVPTENTSILSEQLVKISDPKRVETIVRNFIPNVPVNKFGTVSGAFPKSMRQAVDLPMTPQEKIGFKTSPVLQSQVVDPLTTEARKYKSAEEFVNSQTKLLHGTNKKFDVFDTSKLGMNEKDVASRNAFFFTDSLDTAKSYGKNLQERYGGFKNPKVIDMEGEMLSGGSSGKDIRGMMNEAVLDAKKNGNDVVIFKNLSDRKDWGNYEVATHYAVVDTNKLLTKEQLINIWESQQKLTGKKSSAVKNVSAQNLTEAEVKTGIVKSQPANATKSQLTDIWKKANLENNSQAGFLKVPDTMNYEQLFKTDTEKMFKSNIRVDKFAVSPEGQSNLARIVEENKNFIKQRRGVQSVEQTKKLADQIIPSLKLKKGTALNAEELQAMGDTVAGLQTKVDDFSRLITSGKNTDDNILALAQAKEELTFALSSLSGATAEAGRSLNILKNLRKAGATRDSKLIQEAIKISGGRETAENIARKFVELGDDNLGKIKFLRDIAKVKVGDKIYEVWLNSILSNPVTQIVNITGNTLQGLLTVPTRLVQSVIDKKVFAGEVPHQIMGAIEGLQYGVQKALYVLRNGLTPSQISKLDVQHLPAIKGIKGEILRTPTKLLSAMDEFFKAITGTSEMRSLAYRQARQEGLKGEQAIKRMHELIENPTKELYEAVDFSRLSATFQQPLGKAGKAVMQFRDNFPGAKYVIPFIKTPTNIAKEAIKTSPLGFLNVLRKAKLGKYADLPENEMTREIAQAAIGSAISIPVVFASLRGDITGAAPTNANERDAFYRKGMQPYSIKVGDSWYSYRRVEPLATVIGTIADLTKITDEEGIEEAAKSVATTIGRNLNDKTFLSGISSFIEALTDDEKRSQWVNRTAEGLVPFSGTRRLVTQTTDPTIRKPEGLVETLEANIPGLSENVPARLDNFGQPAEKTLSQIVSPIGVTKEKSDKVEQELEKLKITIGSPSKTIAGQELTRDEYQRYQRTSGIILKNVLSTIVSDSSWESLNDREKEVVINRATNKVREKVKTSLFPLKSKASEIKKRIQDRGYTSDQAEKLTEKIINGQISE